MRTPPTRLLLILGIAMWIWLALAVVRSNKESAARWHQAVEACQVDRGACPSMKVIARERCLVQQDSGACQVLSQKTPPTPEPKAPAPVRKMRRSHAPVPAGGVGIWICTARVANGTRIGSG